MKDNEIEFPENGPIDRAAAEWVAKRVKGFTAGEQDAFFEWLAEDPRHSEWYARHMKTWKHLDQLAQWKPEHSERANQDLLKYQVIRSRWSWVSGIAAAFALSAILWFALEPDQQVDERTTISLVANGYESHVLPDGSIVEMNRGTALKVDYTPEFRRVELVSNEAHFDVAKNPDRPFVVHVRGVDFQAVGTAFNVRLKEKTVELLVTEGRVRMTAVNPDLEQGSPESFTYDQEVVAGQMSVASIVGYSALPEVLEVSAVVVDEMLAWKPMLLDFDEIPLREIVEEFNRYNAVQLEIRDESLEQEPIVASFRTTNIDHFVELLELSLGVQSERIGDERIVLSRP